MMYGVMTLYEMSLLNYRKNSAVNRNLERVIND